MNQTKYTMTRRIQTFLTVCAIIALGAACGKETPEKEPKKDPDPVQPAQKEEKLSTAFLSARETVAAMGAGWNLGNTLDANSGDTTNMWIEHWGPCGVADYEKAWGQVPPTGDLFKMFREAGFRSIRVPVTWYPHMGTQFKTELVNGQPLWKPSLNPLGDTVDPLWMAEVKRVVDAVLAADMYCIINVHHDTGTANTHWIVADGDNHAKNSGRFKSLWSQIAETFKDYDGRLLFEAYNEMTDAADSWCFASFGTQANYDAAMAADAYAAVNAYAQDFVDVVRASGGKNADRNLLVNTYAACSGEGNWNNHLLDPLKEMKLPADSAKEHIIFQVHYYPTFSSYDEGKRSVDSFISGLNSTLVPKGAPVIIGEWGVGEGSGVSYDRNRPAYLGFAQYFVEQARKFNMATFYWMGISDGADRSVPKFTQQDLAEVIVKGAAPSAASK